VKFRSTPDAPDIPPFSRNPVGASNPAPGSESLPKPVNAFPTLQKLFAGMIVAVAVFMLAKLVVH